MEKFVVFAIKRPISTFAAHVLLKKVHEIEMGESNESSEQSNYEFFH